MSSNLLRCMSVAILIAALAHTTRAQTEVIRGRVTDDSSHGLAATVVVTRGPDRLTLPPWWTAPATTGSPSRTAPATTSSTSRPQASELRAGECSDREASTSSSRTSPWHATSRSSRPRKPPPRRRCAPRTSWGRCSPSRALRRSGATASTDSSRPPWPGISLRLPGRFPTSPHAQRAVDPRVGPGVEPHDAERHGHVGHVDPAGGAH